MPQKQQERAHDAHGSTNNTTYTSGMDRRQGRSSHEDDDSASAYRKANPKVVEFRRKPLPYYDELVELFEGTSATGEYTVCGDKPSPMNFSTLSDDASLSSSVSEEAARDDDVAVAATPSNSHTRNQEHEMQ